MYTVLHKGIPKGELEGMIPDSDWVFEEMDSVSRIGDGEGDLVVLGKGVENPFELIREIRKYSKHIGVLIIVPPEKESSYKQALMFSPSVGYHNKVVRHGLPGLKQLITNMASSTLSRQSFSHQYSPLQSPRELPVTGFLESFFDTSPVGAVLADKTGRVLFLNPKARELLRVSESKGIGVSLADFFSRDAGTTIHELIRNPVSGSIIIDQRPEENIVLEISCGEVKNESGPVFNVLILHDITKRVTAEEELRETLRQKEKTNEELQEMVYVVSHDLKAPVRGIATLSQWLVQDYAASLPEEARELLRKLSRRVNRLQGLLEGVLNAYRVGKSEEDFSVFELTPLVREVIELLPPQDGLDIRIGDLGKVNASRDLLRQVFLNLISNAISHNDKNQIVVEVEKTEKDGVPVFCVRDNGPGVEPKYHERIFRMFETLDAEESRKGTGIGLAIVKKILRRHQGRIWIESNPGEGSSFCFSLGTTS